jgi:hypothetical protein
MKIKGNFEVVQVALNANLATNNNIRDVWQSHDLGILDYNKIMAAILSSTNKPLFT